MEIFGGKWISRIICVLVSTLKERNSNEIVVRKSYDQIPPKVAYSLSEKGVSVVPILQNICRLADVFYKDDKENTLIQCKNATIDA